MDESISLLSFSLDQVIVDNDANGIGSLGHVSSILEPTDINLDQTYFVVTSDQFDIINQFEAPLYANGLEIARINDFNQGVNFVTLDQAVAVNQSDIALDHLAVENQTPINPPKTTAEINDEDSALSFINNNNTVQHVQAVNENRNSVIKVRSKLNEAAEKQNDDAGTLDQSEQREIESVAETKKRKNIQKNSSKGKTLPNNYKNKTNTKSKTEIEVDTQTVWTCEHCPDLTFASKNRWDRHRWKQHKRPPKTYPCTECELSFPLASGLKLHMVSVHLHYRPHKCDVCGKTFSKVGDLKKHKDTHSGLTDMSLRTIPEHSPDLTIASKNCDHHHRKEHNLSQSQPKTYPCTECELSFPLASELKLHMVSVHLHYRPHKCEVCGKTFSKVGDLRKHRDTHSGHTDVSLHAIPEHSPDLTTASKDNWDFDHRKEHNLLQPQHKMYPCTECELSFPLAYRLKVHMRSVHLHYRPYKCDDCGKTFSKLSDLKKHKDTHSLNKNYTCVICNKEFTDMSNLERHKVVHTNEKPFKCRSCGKRYMQLSSLRKHRTESQAAILGPCGGGVEAVRQYHCRTCGESFKYKKFLADHEKTHKVDLNKISDLGRNVDALIQDILNDDIIHDTTKIDEIPHLETMQSEDLGVNLHETNKTSQNHDENSFEIELINEIDRLEGLTTEANEVTANSGFQMQADFFTGSIDPPMNFNINPQYLNQFENLPIGKDENIYNVSSSDVSFHNMGMEGLSDELLMPKETEIVTSLVCETAGVGDCATIFESDVDLETSANLAANLNQLIAENNVEFVSTEDDDTFIINLNSGIDAEQLSDLLNIGIEVIEPTPVDNVNVSLEDHLNVNIQVPHQTSFDLTPLLEESGKHNKKERTKFVPPEFTCKVCLKVFTKRDNYISHLGLHDPSMSRHKCAVCKLRFGYRSTLNKHMLAAHTPAVWTSHQCHLCSRRYRHKWMLKQHLDGHHNKITPYRCNLCPKMFHKLSDFSYHRRSHVGERPYRCGLCHLRFVHASHRSRHRRRCAQQNYRHRKEIVSGSKPAQNLSIEMSKELLSDIDDLLKSKMSTIST